MATLTVTIELRDGVEIDTAGYRAGHGGHPDGHACGQWGFRPLAPDPSAPCVWLEGELLDVVDDLEPGRWALFP